jgi:hypothetical protein
MPLLTFSLILWARDPARGMDVCLRLFCVCVVLFVQGVLVTVYKCKITEPHKEEAKADMGYSAI